MSALEKNDTLEILARPKQKRQWDVDRFIHSNVKLMGHRRVIRQS